jgi:hypothetical protein
MFVMIENILSGVRHFMDVTLIRRTDETSTWFVMADARTLEPVADGADTKDEAITNGIYPVLPIGWDEVDTVYHGYFDHNPINGKGKEFCQNVE